MTDDIKIPEIGTTAPLFGTHTSRGLTVEEDPMSDFRVFLWVCWDHLKLPDPTPVQYDIAFMLMLSCYGKLGPEGESLIRMIIQAYRGAGKSWITSALVVWLLYMNPQLNIMVVSASKLRADDFSTFTLRLIKEMPILQHLAPRGDQRASNVGFDVALAGASHATSVRSFGITSQLTGGRADVVVGDDIEVPGNSATAPMRDKLSELVKEFDAVLKPNGRIIYLGTPQCEMSLYNTLQTRGYTAIIWPARFPEPKKMIAYGKRLALFLRKQLDAAADLVGRSTDAKRFTDIDLRERELSYGRSGFALQFMLDTSMADAEKFPLKLADLIIMDVNEAKAPAVIMWGSGPNQVIKDLPMVGFTGDRYNREMHYEGEWLEYGGAVMSIDPSGRGKDETSYAVVKNLHSRLFVPAAGGLKGGYSDDTLKALAEIAKLHKVKLILIEDNFGDGMFNELLKPWLRKIGYPCTVEGIRSNKQKEARIIDTLEPVMNQHRLVIDPSVVRSDFSNTSSSSDDGEETVKITYQLFYQMSRITRDKGALVHDDRLDALAIAVAYWVDQMAVDQEEESERINGDKLMEEIRMMTDGIPMDLGVVLTGTSLGNSNLAGAGRWGVGRR
jgi:hypothetical protein